MGDIRKTFLPFLKDQDVVTAFAESFPDISPRAYKVLPSLEKQKEWLRGPASKVDAVAERSDHAEIIELALSLASRVSTLSSLAENPHFPPRLVPALLEKALRLNASGVLDKLTSRFPQLCLSEVSDLLSADSFHPQSKVFGSLVSILAVKPSEDNFAKALKLLKETPSPELARQVYQGFAVKGSFAKAEDLVDLRMSFAENPHQSVEDRDKYLKPYWGVNSNDLWLCERLLDLPQTNLLDDKVNKLILSDVEFYRAYINACSKTGNSARFIDVLMLVIESFKTTPSLKSGVVVTALRSGFSGLFDKRIYELGLSLGLESEGWFIGHPSTEEGLLHLLANLEDLSDLTSYKSLMGFADITKLRTLLESLPMQKVHDLSGLFNVKTLVKLLDTGAPPQIAGALSSKLKLSWSGRLTPTLLDAVANHAPFMTDTPADFTNEQILTLSARAAKGELKLTQDQWFHFFNLKLSDEIKCFVLASAPLTVLTSWFATPSYRSSLADPAEVLMRLTPAARLFVLGACKNLSGDEEWLTPILKETPGVLQQLPHRICMKVVTAILAEEFGADVPLWEFAASLVETWSGTLSELMAAARELK